MNAVEVGPVSIMDCTADDFCVGSFKSCKMQKIFGSLVTGLVWLVGASYVMAMVLAFWPRMIVVFFSIVLEMTAWTHMAMVKAVLLVLLKNS